MLWVCLMHEALGCPKHSPASARVGAPCSDLHRLWWRGLEASCSRMLCADVSDLIPSGDAACGKKAGVLGEALGELGRQACSCQTKLGEPYGDIRSWGNEEIEAEDVGWEAGDVLGPRWASPSPVVPMKADIVSLPKEPVSFDPTPELEGEVRE
jgi:hypothetical protein